MIPSGDGAVPGGAEAPSGDAPGLEFRLAHDLRSADGGFMRLNVAGRLREGEWLALMGPSGAGKTSLLRMIAGLMPTSSGFIRRGNLSWLDTAGRTALPARDRRIGYVFQDYGLFPNMPVRRQVAFAQRRPDSRRVEELLDLVGLGGLADAYPQQLSGGQQQRLALVRALAPSPELLLLDEPLSALDPAMRRDLRELLQGIRRGDTGPAPMAILVTHDPGEAVRLADRAMMLAKGRILFSGPPALLFGQAPDRDLVLEGRVVGREEGGACYRVEAEGRALLVEGPPDADLAPGSLVLVTADRLRARALNAFSGPGAAPRGT